MRCDIVTRGKYYKGMGRTFDTDCLLTKELKQYHNLLLDIYFRYNDIMVADMEVHDCFMELVQIYNELKKYKVDCELIVYDDKPIEQVNLYDLKFLGIDIVHDLCETLLSEKKEKRISSFLNENGLCKSEEDVKRLIPMLKHGDVKWKPCYIYEVLIR